MKYNLGVLNNIEFEDLCKDLLDLELDLNLQIFKNGADGGIDLLYSHDVENEIVVQVKHYEISGYYKLKAKLIGDELLSINKMNPKPKRYFLATSVPLSPKQSNEIKELLSPYIHSTNDIYGRRRIESLISKYPSVESKFFKLWLTSTNVLEQILNNAIVNNSEFNKERIISRAKLYVPNSNFNLALKKLEENKFLIISGAPGVGKTTLAYMLIYERLAAGFQLIYGDGTIIEIEGMLSKDPEKKQIFLLDDFLGANLYDIWNQKNPENKIMSFINRIQHSKNKFLILTSRTTILNQANHRYENLKRSNLTEISKYELKLSEYSLLDKANILYNHLYFNNLKTNFHLAFYNKKTYVKILNHPNYYPRTIEFITDETRYSSEKYETIEQFIFDKLDNPEQIWTFAFEEQLDDEDRFVVMSLFSLGGENINQDVLEEAFEERYKYEIRFNNKNRKSRAFTNSLKKLLDGFLRAEQDDQTGRNSFFFLNPSITDFLLDYVKRENEEKNRILKSIAFTEQITNFFSTSDNDKIILEKRILKPYFPHFLELSTNLKSARLNISSKLEVLNIFMNFFRENLSFYQAYVIDLLQSILSESTYVNSGNLSLLLVNFHKDNLTDVIEMIGANFDSFIGIIISKASARDDLWHLVEIFKLYKKDFLIYLDHDEFKYNIQAKLGEIFEGIARDMDHNDQYIGDLVDMYGEHQAAERISQTLWEEYCEFVGNLDMNEYFEILDHSYNVNASDIVSNSLEYLHESHRESNSNRSISNFTSPTDPWTVIDRLFKKK